MDQQETSHASGTGKRRFKFTDLQILILVAAIRFLIHLFTNNQYGFHQDALAFLANGIHLDWGYKLPKEDIYSYDIDPHDLITQVMIDPRISYDEFKKIHNDIKQETGYMGDIKRSLLYRLPDSLTIEVEQNITHQ